MKLNSNIELKDINKIFSNGGRYAKWRVISILTVGFMLISAFFTADFIYQNIYMTLSNANTIVVLSSNLSIDTIDLKNYNLAEERKGYKTETFSWPNNIRNAFNYETKTNSTSTTSTISTSTTHTNTTSTTKKR